MPRPPKTMVKYLSKPGKVPTEYVPQVYGQMLVCDLEAVHFYAYHPDMPAHYVLVRRDEKQLKALADKLEKFVGEMYELEEIFE